MFCICSLIVHRKASNARYAAYVWTSGKEQWFDLSQEDGDVYRVELTAEATSWSNIIFVKMKPNTTGNNWDNKDAQTEDLKYSLSQPIPIALRLQVIRVKEKR